MTDKKLELLTPFKVTHGLGISGYLEIRNKPSPLRSRRQITSTVLLSYRRLGT